MRVLGIDLGTKRIGLAISDETGSIASGIGTYTRRSLSDDIQYIKNILIDRAVRKIVLGLPVNMNGTIGPKAEESLKFKSDLEKHVEIPVELFDERMTSAEAERVLIEANITRKKRKELLDQQAAVLILQGYLNHEKNPGISH